MRKFLIFIIVASAFMFNVNAQFYCSPYQQQQAYEYGRQLAIQQQKQQQGGYLWGYGLGLLQNGLYSEALEAFEESWTDYDYAASLYYIGLCHELGIGCERDLEFADYCYEEGALHNDLSCKVRINQINREGHYSKSYRATFLNRLSSNNSSAYSTTPSIGGSYSSGSSAGTASSRTCPSCHGTGKGTDNVTYAPNYTGNQTSVYCSICGRTTSPHTHHTPNCPVCYGRGTVD